MFSDKNIVLEIIRFLLKINFLCLKSKRYVNILDGLMSIFLGMELV